MIDFAIISRHAVPNYGSLLQAYALQQALENLGATTIYINYQNSKEQLPAREITLLRISHWNRNVLKRIVFFLTKVPADLCAFLRFKTFQKRLLKMSELYSSQEDLEKKPLVAKAFLTGSDQVWNVTHQNQMDEVYYLAFSQPGVPRFSYSASMGDPIKMGLWKEKIKRLLLKYNNVSVRELQAKDFIEPIRSDVAVVCDPVFLQTKEQWLSFAGPRPKINGEYVLVYCLAKNKQLESFAREFSDRTGCILVGMNAYYTQLVGDYDKRVLLPSPEMFLSWIYHAKYIITDSFHGTAFSILLHKQFVEFIPEGNPCRNKELLRKFMLEKRIVTDLSEGLELAHQPIVYEETEKVIEDFRQEGIQYLKDMIKDIL